MLHRVNACIAKGGNWEYKAYTALALELFFIFKEN